MSESAVPVRLAVAPQPLRLAWQRRVQLALVATDAAAIVVAIAVAQLGRFGTAGLRGTAPHSIEYRGLALIVALAWLLGLWATRSRDRRILGVGLTEYGRVANATFFTFGLLAILAYLAQLTIARGYLAIALPLGLALLLAGRLYWRGRVHAMRRAGRCLTGAIVVGGGAEVERAVAELRGQLRAGYKAIAVALTDDREPNGPASALPRVQLDELVDTVRSSRTRAVMIAGGLPGGNEQIRELGWAFEDSGVELILVSRLIEVAGPRMHWRPVEGLPMVHVDLPRFSGFNYTVKRAFDIVVGAVGLIVASPLMLVVALAVMSDGGPVLFRQQRVGMRGGRFAMLKFRSMVVDAEARLPELTQRNEGAGPLFKMRDDPRVTRVGRVIRRLSLDELPQLLNVLRGEMSLVGPRPPLPREVDHYEGRANRRLLIKPGITGPWQVSGRSELSWEESVKLDLWYVENWSLTNDMMILLRTARTVLTHEGAY
ncbi:sugar transferase [Gryllotalpicola daejeonensis]|uniref:Sugar transferase n=1 Tax=Gryllotalpicola daejeonensis TaxID=993087 RepID=A0ABP7ZLJ7_9MICO